MALLDRFRAQPRQKHPDPAVRLAFVQEIPLDDADPKVRRAAVAKLMDPPALAAVVRHDNDEGVRAHAVSMLRDIAVEVFEGIGEPESGAAIDALASLPDMKTLSAIAKT